MSSPTGRPCPVVENLISPLNHALTPREKERLTQRWPSAFPQVGDDATQRRAAFLAQRTLEKYSVETMNAVGAPEMVKHLNQVPDRETAVHLTTGIADFLTDKIRRNPQARNADQLRAAARVCSHTSQSITAYPDDARETARHAGMAMSNWSAAARVGIIHELHTLLAEISSIR